MILKVVRFFPKTEFFITFQPQDPKTAPNKKKKGYKNTIMTALYFDVHLPVNVQVAKYQKRRDKCLFRPHLCSVVRFV